MPWLFLFGHVIATSDATNQVPSVLPLVGSTEGWHARLVCPERGVRQALRLSSAGDVSSSLRNVQCLAFARDAHLEMG